MFLVFRPRSVPQRVFKVEVVLSLSSPHRGGFHSRKACSWPSKTIILDLDVTLEKVTLHRKVVLGGSVLVKGR